jgi:hypothetical protein
MDSEICDSTKNFDLKTAMIAGTFGGEKTAKRNYIMRIGKELAYNNNAKGRNLLDENVFIPHIPTQKYI